MNKVAVVLCLLCATSVFAGNRKEIPVVPLPAVILQAKKVFLTHGGGSNLGYNAFHSALTRWGKYQFVGSPDQADLILELADIGERGGIPMWSTNNTDHGTREIASQPNVDPQLMLTIYNARTKDLLWSEVDHHRGACREKKDEKETVKAAERLAAYLKARAELPQ